MGLLYIIGYPLIVILLMLIGMRYNKYGRWISASLLGLLVIYFFVAFIQMIIR